MQYSLFVLSLALYVSLVNSQSSRTVYIVNNCKQDYYFAVTPGAAPYNPAYLTSCSSNANCITGSHCDTAAKVCFWDTPSPDNGNYFVSAGHINSITFPYINNGNSIQWSGKFGFCYNASCSASAQVCNQQGCSVTSGPSNIAEITFQKQTVDFYDISNIGGINVPMSMNPNGGSLVATDPYRCGTPGSMVGLNSIAASTWNLSPPYIQNTWVIGSGQTCTSNADCSGTQKCGLTSVPGRTPMFQMQCGEFYGYWTANSVCAQDTQNSLSPNPFNCPQALQNGPLAATYGGLYQCIGTSGSGYATNADPYVCGCVDWNGINGLVPQVTTKCNNANPLWLSTVLPHIAWLKIACPSCYTYPYDDMSSTFVCENLVNGYNNLDYTVTLCPATTTATTAPSSPTPTPTTAPTATATVRPTARPSAAPTSSVATSAPTSAAPACTVTCAPNMGCCGANCYSTASYTCWPNGLICLKGYQTCGNSCYQPSSFSCTNGVLKSL